MKLRRAVFLIFNAAVGLTAGCLVIRGDLVIFKQRESVSAVSPIGDKNYPASQPADADPYVIPDILRGARP